MEFKYVGHTTLPMLYKVLEKEANEVNRRGHDIRSIKGLRLLLASFEDKSLTATSETVDEFLDITFYFELDWCLVQDIAYHIPALKWVYKLMERSDCQRGLVTGSLSDWNKLRTLDKRCQLSSELGTFVQHLKSYLDTIV